MGLLSCVCVGFGSVVWGNVGGFKRLVVYYGWLNTSNLLDLGVDVVVAAGSSRVLPGGSDRGVVEELIARGVEVYAYLHDFNDTPVGLGSSFRVMVVENTSGTLAERYGYWLGYIESLIDRYAGLFTGVFFDECDPSYFTSNLSSEYVRWFTWGIGNLTEYAHSRGLKVFINGVMGYAGYGDYYLWEDFVTGYDYVNNTYVYLDDFLVEQNYSSPLEWVNGISRYYYLRDHGLLNRTLAVTFADPDSPETIEWARVAYALARIMGLAGWGYADVNFYSSGGAVPLVVPVYEYGLPISSPVIDSSQNYASRVFAATGKVEVHYGNRSVVEHPVYVEEPVIDALEDSVYTVFAGNVSGVYTTIGKASIVAGNGTLYLYVEIGTNSSGGLLHVYVDVDGNNSTGYIVGGVGADYLVEVYTDFTAMEYQYAGKGSDWNWSNGTSIPLSYKDIGVNDYALEMRINVPGLKANYTRIIVATVYNWGDDASTSPYTIEEVHVLQPLFYASVSGEPIIVSYSVSNDTVVLVGSASPGTLANYTFYTPFTEVIDVLVNNTSIPRLPSTDSEGQGYNVTVYNGYSKLVALARHHSNITVAVKGVQQLAPIREPWTLPLILVAAVMAMVVILTVAVKKGVS